MSGSGRRYREAGYDKIKPLIEVDGSPMIRWVIEMFPDEDDFLFICNREHLEQTELREVLKKYKPSGEIVAIEPHKLGPVHAVLEAKDKIKADTPTIVNYCDFSVQWDYKHFKNMMLEKNFDGAIPSYRGFHPHSLGPTYYGYIREENQHFLEIREKESFTDDRMNEFASAGTYYFSSGEVLTHYFEQAIERNLQTNGEFYASLPFNLMQQDGKDIYVYELDKFLQWGTPEDLEEYQSRSDHFRNEYNWKPKKEFGCQCLIPMAGEGSRFKQEGYKDPKPMIDVGGEPMIQRAAESAPKSESYTFVCREHHLTEYPLEKNLKEMFGDKARIITVDHLTEGQACTCMLAEESLDSEKPLFIGACDNGMVWNEEEYEKLISDKSVDVVAWTHRNYIGAKWNPKAYGWVHADKNGKVESVSVKVPISDTPGKDPGIVGSFWFRRAGDFFDATRELVEKDERVNGEFYVDSVMNAAIRLGKNVHIFDIDRYICWGTPDDYRAWNYWKEYFRGSEN